MNAQSPPEWPPFCVLWTSQRVIWEGVGVLFTNGIFFLEPFKAILACPVKTYKKGEGNIKGGYMAGWQCGTETAEYSHPSNFFPSRKMQLLRGKFTLKASELVFLGLPPRRQIWETAVFWNPPKKTQEIFPSKLTGKNRHLRHISPCFCCSLRVNSTEGRDIPLFSKVRRV